MSLTTSNRQQDIETCEIKYNQVLVNATLLLSILKQASHESQNRGWGKLLGYLDLDTNKLMVEESYGLLLPRTDQKMKNEDNMDDLVKSNLNELSYKYRQVGFYIFSEDNDIFTFPILNYIINNEKFGIAKVFLHVSIQNAKLGKNPFVFYEISEAVNRLLTLKKTESNKSYYEIEEANISQFNAQSDSIFTSIPFKIQKSDIFNKFYYEHPDLFTRFINEERKEGGKLSDNITQGLNECIHKHASLLQQYLSNKKAQKKASSVNLFGSYERMRKTLGEKKEIIKEVVEKMDRINEKLN